MVVVLLPIIALGMFINEPGIFEIGLGLLFLSMMGDSV
tara:strand:+ start:1137 stop:1250 length:114 start_codon:yes stop_codon:yes gene_type:complete